jgi:hypothetical protein
MQTSDKDGFLILGDLNARFGQEREVHVFLEGQRERGAQMMSYSNSPDTITQANANAQHVKNTLGQHLILLNGLKYEEKTFPTTLTYRQRTKWISELDIGLASPIYLPLIEEFTIHQRTDLPSDHAPVSCTVSLKPVQVNHQPIKEIAQRARHLGNHHHEASGAQQNSACNKLSR